jgi:hypothetical protein
MPLRRPMTTIRCTSGGPEGGGRTLVPKGMGSPACEKNPRWTSPGAFMIENRAERSRYS